MAWRVTKATFRLWPKFFFAQMWLIFSSQTTWNLMFLILIWPLLVLNLMLVRYFAMQPQSEQSYQNSCDFYATLEQYSFMGVTSKILNTRKVVSEGWWCFRTCKYYSDSSIYKQNMRARIINIKKPCSFCPCGFVHRLCADLLAFCGRSRYK